MNPFKKIENAKNNQAQASSWLLCPSKSFPGKFYYFNGSTGETAWSLSDTDKNLKKSPIHRVTDKAHTYPEPFGPPIDVSVNTTNSSSLKNTGNTFTHNPNVRPSPVFGQAVFPQYLPPNCTPEFVWALTPMYVPTQMPQHRQMLDQMTRTYEPEQPMFVPSLNSRFQASNISTFPPELQFQPFKENPIFDQASNFEPMVHKPKMKDEACQTFVPRVQIHRTQSESDTKPMVHKPKMKDEACQTFVPRVQIHRTQSESDTKPKSALKRSRSVENHSLTKDTETSTLSPPSKVENRNDKFSELDKNDLRFKLLAKKRKVETVVGEKAEKSTEQSKATKMQGLAPEGILPKKRVTFDLQEPAASHTSSADVQVTDQSPDPHIEGPLWYVAADTEALLSGLHSIMEIVKSDASCRLLVCHAVYSELKSLGRGESGAVAVSARQVIRKLIAHNNIVVQSKPDYELSSEDSILQWCWSLLQEDCHVILITNNKNIGNKAKTINLECYTPDDIKMDEHIGNGIDTVPQNDLAKLKIIVDNDKSVPKNVEKIDASDLDIRRLNIIENNQEKSTKDSIKVSGITKLNNQFNLEEELGRFCIKNSVMETRVKSRLDEWVCRLSQTMEGALTDLLLKEKTKSKRMMPPKNPLFEVIQGTGEIFKKHTNIKLIIDQFPITLINCSFNNGKLKKDLKPNEFMELVGFSVILIDQLKEILNCKELYEAEEMLECLIKNIEDPKTDIELSLEKVTTPIFSRSEIEDSKTPIVFKKSRTEVVDYLKKHFTAWQSERDMTDTVDAIDNEPNILITSGKNLNMLKINNTKTITVENNKDSAPNYTQTNNENNEKLNANNQPKVIQNVKIRDAFEERPKKHAQPELDKLDYEENEAVYTICDITEIKSEKPDECQVKDDLSVSESAADTECTRAYPLVRIFLVKVKSTLLRVFNFINRSIQEYQEGMSLDKKADMKRKTELARNSLLKIAERLKNIIARESGDGMTLKHLLIKAGDYVEDDVVIANYKQTVTEFLEQANKLEEILQYLLTLGVPKSATEHTVLL